MVGTILFLNFKNYVKHVCAIYKEWKIGKIQRRKYFTMALIRDSKICNSTKMGSHCTSCLCPVFPFVTNYEHCFVCEVIIEALY